MKFNELDSYFSIRGRTNRMEFWVASIIACIVFMAYTFGAVEYPLPGFDEGDHAIFVGISVSIVAFICWWAIMATAVRRCRDIGLNPWFSLVINIPYIGLLAWFIIGCLNSKD